MWVEQSLKIMAHRILKEGRGVCGLKKENNQGERMGF